MIRTAISPRLATSTRRSVDVWVALSWRDGRLYCEQHVPSVDAHSVLDEHPDHGSRDARTDVVHQLHHLDDAQGAAGLHIVADVGERWSCPGVVTARRSLAMARSRRVRRPECVAALAGSTSAEIGRRPQHCPGRCLFSRRAARPDSRAQSRQRSAVASRGGSGVSPSGRRSRPSRSARRHRRLP